MSFIRGHADDGLKRTDGPFLTYLMEQRNAVSPVVDSKHCLTNKLHIYLKTFFEKRRLNSKLT